MLFKQEAENKIETPKCFKSSSSLQRISIKEFEQNKVHRGVCVERYLEKQCRCGENRNIEVGKVAEFAIEEEGARSEIIISSEAIGEDSERARQFHGVRNVTNF